MGMEREQGSMYHREQASAVTEAEKSYSHWLKAREQKRGKCEFSLEGRQRWMPQFVTIKQRQPLSLTCLGFYSGIW